MEREFEIGYADYNVVGSLDNNARSVEKDEDIFRGEWRNWSISDPLRWDQRRKYDDAKQENIEKFSNESEAKGTAFAQLTDLFWSRADTICR